VKTAAERSIEVLTWASVAIWLGFILVAHVLNYIWLVMMVLSIILLSSAIYQRSRGWHTSMSIWIFGIWMAVFSVIEIVSEVVGIINEGAGLEIDLWVYLGIALVSMGVAAVFSTIQGPNLATNRRATAQRDTRGTDQDRSRYIPRRVDEDLSSGYIPSPQDRADYTSGRSRGRQRDEYDQPTSRRTGRQRAASSAYDQGYDDQPAPSGRADYDPDRTRQYQPEDMEPGWSERQPEPPPRERRGASPRQRQRPARPAADAPSDLESRVDDIIRRSRERRGQPGDEELPY
jgi:hypothetical protein